jgi:hypothetical protein
MAKNRESASDMTDMTGPPFWKHPFDEGDLDLMVEALSLVPDLEFAVYLTKVACSRLQFPVVSHEHLCSQLGAQNASSTPDSGIGFIASAALPKRREDDIISYRNRRVTSADITRYLPAEVFPIEGPDDCLGKALIGLCWGGICHQSRTPN